MNDESNQSKLQKTPKSSQIDLTHFYYLISSQQESKQYIKTIYNFFNNFYAFNSAQYNALNQLYFDFSSKKSDNNFINTPIYLVECTLKKLMQVQLKLYESIIGKYEAFKLIINNFQNLEKIIQDLSTKFNGFSYRHDIFNDINYISNSIMEKMNDLEMKVMDDYIFDKYKKHVIKVCEENADDIASEIKNLENTIYNYIKEKKSQYYFKLKKSANHILNIYNDIKTNLRNYILLIKEINNIFVNDLGNLLNDLPISSNEDLNKSEKIDIESQEKDYYTIKYNISILKNNKIKLKGNDNKSTENKIHGDKNKKFEKSETSKHIDIHQEMKHYEENFLFLTDKDVFEIIAKLYSYDLKVLDKSHYNIEQEKEKYITIDLSHELLELYSDDNETSINKLNENYNEVINIINGKILNNIRNIESFLIALNNYRVTGKVKFNEKFFDIVVYIYNKAQDILIKNNNAKLGDLIIILSLTYYKEIKGEKIYLLKEINTHDIYKTNDFWKDIIIKKIETEFKSFLVSSKTLTKEKKEKIITTQLINYSCFMIRFNFIKSNMSEVFNQIFDKYKCSEFSREQVLSFISKI